MRNFMVSVERDGKETKHIMCDPDRNATMYIRLYIRTKGESGWESKLAYHISCDTIDDELRIKVWDDRTGETLVRWEER